MGGNFPVNIIVAALNHSFIMRLPKNMMEKPSGIDGRLLETLSQVLKFRYQLTSPVDKEWGRIKDGNWTGLVGMIHKGEADFAMTAVAVTQDRMTAVDFSLPYIISDATFVTEFPRLVPRAYACMYSFDLYTWLGILALLFVMPVVFFVTTKGKESLQEALFVVFAQLLGKSLSRRALDGKLLTICWLFSAFVISLSYSAVLSSFLFLPIRYPPVKNFIELAKGVQRKEFEVFIMTGSLHVAQLIQTKTDHLVGIGQAIEENSWFVKSNQDPYSVLSKPGVAFINNRMYANYHFGLPPSTTKFISDDGCYLMFMGMAMSKTFCCRNVVNEALVRISEAGLIDKFLKDEMLKYMPVLLKYRAQVAGNDRRALSASDLSGAFAVLLIGYMASFVALLVEKLYIFGHHWFKNYLKY